MFGGVLGRGGKGGGGVGEGEMRVGEELELKVVRNGEVMGVIKEIEEGVGGKVEGDRGGDDGVFEEYFEGEGVVGVEGVGGEEGEFGLRGDIEEGEMGGLNEKVRVVKIGFELGELGGEIREGGRRGLGWGDGGVGGGGGRV